MFYGKKHRLYASDLVILQSADLVLYPRVKQTQDGECKGLENLLTQQIAMGKYKMEYSPC